MRSLHPWPILPLDLDPPAARSFCLLLILQEFLLSCQLLDLLKKSPPSNLSDLSDQMEKFLLFSLDQPFSQTGGILDKLCFYCESLLKASKVMDDGILLTLEEMRNSILKVKSRLRTWGKKAPPSEEVLSTLQSLYSELRGHLGAFFSALCPFLHESCTNENILIYLVEHREQLNLFLGPRTIESLLRRFFPSGPYALRAAICEGYTRRGFTEFYSQKEPFLDAIQWEETSCQPPSLN